MDRDTQEDSGDWTPRPDPTQRTQEQLRRELSSLREIIEARLDGMDRALLLIQSSSDRVPSEVDQKLASAANFYSEKFHSIEGRLLERDKRFEQGANDAKTALDTALAAQMRETASALNAAKEAVEKSELAFGKQVDQLGIQGQTVSQALDNKITDLKDRLEASINAVALRAEAAISALRAELLPQITGERTRGDRGEGRQLGQGAMIALIFGAISAIGVIIGFVVILTRVN